MIRPLSILCPTDFSAPARDAARRAAHLARDSGASLTLMHVAPEGVLADLRRRFGASPATEQQIGEQVRQRIEQLRDELQAEWQVRARTMHAFGSVVDEIIFEASALPADLVVLGARGAGTLKRLMLGTTAERLLRVSRRPMLVVRQPPDRPYRRVLVGIDFSPSTPAVLAAARWLAPQAQLRLLHAIEWAPLQAEAAPEASGAARPPEPAHAEAAERLEQLAAQAGLAAGSWQPCILEGRASTRLLEQEPSCDLVVVGKHGHTLSENLLLGSVTQHVLAEGQADALIVRDAPT